MAGRCLPFHDRVTIQLDGEAIDAERGEPIAAALLAAGKLALARSPKFHRPRGPACMRAACDGCLARVDDVPNVMTCMVPAREGTVVRTQNTLGSRETDLLRMTDWFFPNGMNHHELFAGVPGVQQIMQTFARRVAGLGKLPTEVTAARTATRRAADIVVIGAGAAGMLTASLAARAGRQVEVIDDALEPGGATRALHGEDAAPWLGIAEEFRAFVHAGKIALRSATTVVAIYGDDLLVVGEAGAEVVTARATVIAAGAHDGGIAFEGNDVPGVMSARAAGWLLARGVLVGTRLAIVVDPGDGGGPFGEAYARARRAVDDDVEIHVVRGVPVHAEGSASVKALTVRDEGGNERRIKVDAVLLDAPRAPAYELCEQAGARLEHAARGYLPRLVGGKIRDGFFVVGEAAGGAFEAGGFSRAAREVVGQLG